MTSAFPAQPRKAALAFIFMTILMDVLALGIILPVLPRLVQSFMGEDPARGAEMYGIFGTVWAAMQFVFSPFMGALSDRFGRRLVILIALTGLGLDYIFMALAPTLGWLFVGRMISGVTGASYTAAAAYIADITPPEKRASSYALMGAAWGTGFVLGPLMGGVLGAVNPRFPFWAAAGLALINALYGWFVLPESLPPERRSAFQWRRANPVGSLGLLRSSPGLLGLSCVHFLYWVSHHVLTSVMVLYTAYRYGWGPRTMGFMLAAVGVCNILVQATLVRHIVARLGERRTLLVGLTMGAAGFCVYGLAPAAWMFCLGVPVFAWIGLYTPSVQGLMTRRVGATEQGQLQGANSSIMGISGMLGPGLFTFTFATFIDSRTPVHLPGAPFLLAALLLLAGAAVAWNAAREPARARA